MIDVLTVRWATGDLPEHCKFLLNTIDVPAKKTRTYGNNVDDDEWIRLLAAAEDVRVDVPETNAVYADGGTAAATAEVDPMKCVPSKW